MFTIDIQMATDKALSVKRSLLRKWAIAVLTPHLPSAEVTIRIVGIKEMTELNTTFRHKPGPTNVLSFPFTPLTEDTITPPLLGDIVICAEVVNREADEQSKTREAHWAHMVIHGLFHLLGYDHEDGQDADIMESLESDLMISLGFNNPYETGDDRSL